MKAVHMAAAHIGQAGAQRALHITPAKYVEDMRLEAARRALELGGLSREDDARRCGCRSVDRLRKAFIRRLGFSPRQYAERFAAARRHQG